MNHRKPIIVVTGPERGGLAAWICLWISVRLAGGVPLRLTPSRATPDRFDGLILGGGADISPSEYGFEAPEPKDSAEQSKPRSLLLRFASLLLLPILYFLRKAFSAKRIRLDSERDRFERALLERALQENRPVLGICRGAQLINVHLGGTLHQEISGFYAEIPRSAGILPRKRVALEPGCQLAEILQGDRCTVNSLHHQAVDQFGNGLQAAARDEADIVQAIEASERPFLIGVQWHPEYMLQSLRQRRIFQRLVRLAGSPDE